MHRDRAHLSEELDFLKQRVGNEQRALENLNQMNRTFEGFNQEMEAGKKCKSSVQRRQTLSCSQPSGSSFRWRRRCN